MTDRYQNKYRIASARHPAWDYGWNAAYFVTICTKDRVCWFGDIVKTQNVASPQKMQFSPIGEIAHQCWLEIPEHFPFVKLGNHIVMPNHVHGIVIIDKPDDGMNTHTVETQNIASHLSQTQNIASHLSQTQNIASLPPNQPKNQFGPQSNNLASIIRGFKIGVTKNARLINRNAEPPDFAWQPRYYDHIIRNEKSFHTISEYIVANPLKWSEDKFYSP